MALHLIKLVVGIDSLDAFEAWRRETAHAQPEWKVRTRQTPKRADALLDGGSIYRVIKGAILCRQKILRVDTVGEGNAARCELVVDPKLVRVNPTPKRPFQGWRYLLEHEAPGDLDGGEPDVRAMPPDLMLRLRELGAW